MTTLTMQRLREKKLAMFGEWRDAAGNRICYNLENAALLIPAGKFLVARRWSPKRNEQVWGLSCVPGRTDIEIHPANDPRQLLGCLAPGTEIGEVSTPQFGDGYGVRHSKDALALIDKVLGGATEWLLVVLDPTPS